MNAVRTVDVHLRTCLQRHFGDDLWEAKELLAQKEEQEFPTFSRFIRIHKEFLRFLLKAGNVHRTSSPLVVGVGRLNPLSGYTEIDHGVCHC